MKMEKIVLLWFAIVLTSEILCSAQVLQFGTCPEVETMRYFNLDKFLGRWYEIERFPTWYEDYGHCAFKTIEACGRRIEIEHGYVREGIQYILHVNSSYAPGDEAVFHFQESNIDPIGIPLSVINTDYSNYAIIYGCKNTTTFGIKYILAWILSREKTLPADIMERAHLELNSIPGANQAYLEPVAQIAETCNYHWTAHINAEYKNPIDEIIN